MDEVTRAIEALKRGEDRERNSRILFDRYYGSVQRFFAKRVSSYEDRLDLTQETFLRVYRGIEGFRGDSQFGTWLFRVAHNTFLKWSMRKRVVTTPLESELEEGDASKEPADTESTPLEKTLDAERSELLLEAVGELPEQMRKCTLLRIEQDLSYREIGAVLHLSTETVKVHLFQARKKLRTSLGDVGF